MVGWGARTSRTTLHQRDKGAASLAGKELEEALVEGATDGEAVAAVVVAAIVAVDEPNFLVDSSDGTESCCILIFCYGVLCQYLCLFGATNRSDRLL